jgi:hypothetical protein
MHFTKHSVCSQHRKACPPRGSRFAAPLAALLCLGALSRGEEAVTFEQHVKPVLRSSCLNCHNPDKAKGGLDMTSFGALMRGGSSGAVVEPGNPDGSRLLLLASRQREPFMPPDAPKRPDAELDVLRKWIAGGLVERAGGQAQKAGARSSLLMAAPEEKPGGPPPMPEGLPLEPLHLGEHPNAVAALAASPWAPLAAVGGYRQVLLYHTETLQLLGVLAFPEGVPHSLRFSRDGRLLTCGGGVDGASGKVVAWDVVTGQRVVELGDEYDSVLSADLAKDRSHVAVGGTDKLVKIYATSTGEVEHRIKKHTDWVTSVAYSPDGVLLATGDRNGGLMVWEAATGLEFYTLEGHPAAITALSWRRDANVLASSGEDGAVKLWNMHDGKQLKSWSACKDGALCVSFGEDGRLVTSGRDRIVKIWDGEGKELLAYPDRGDLVLKTAFSHDGKRVLAGEWSGHVAVLGPDKAAPPLGMLSASPPPVAVQIELALARIPDFLTRRQQIEAAAGSARNQSDAAAADWEKRKAAQQQAAQALQAAESELAGATKSRDEARSGMDAAKAEVDALQAKLKELQAARDQQTHTLGEARTALQSAEGQLPPQRDAVEKARQALEEARADAQATPEYPPAKDKAAAAEASFAAATQKLEELDRKLAEATSTLDLRAQTLAKTESDLAQVNKQGEEAGGRLKEKQSAHDQSAAALAAAEKKRGDAAASRDAAAKAAADTETAATNARKEAGQKDAALADANRAIELGRSDVLRLKAAELDLLAEKARSRLVAQGAKDDSLAASIQAARSAVEHLRVEPAVKPYTKTPEAKPKAGGRRANLALLFVGRYHLVLLHLPIGLLLGVVLLELETWVKRSRGPRRVTGQLLNAAALFAVATSLLGLLLAWNGRYEGLDLWLHLVLGLLTTGGAVAAALLRRSSADEPHRFYRPALFATVAGLVLTGHLGGSMTHGSGFLTQNFSAWVEALRGGSPYADTARGDGLYASTVQPVFEKNCYACHGEKEQKGGYRLDRRDAAFAGGKSGTPAIVPGSPLGSSMAKRLLLPRSHEDAMPPANKPDLRPDEIIAIVRWIAGGADWPEPLPPEAPVGQVAHRAAPPTASATP